MGNETTYLVTRAQGLIDSGQLAEARDLYAQVCAIDASDTNAWLALGVLDGQLGDLGEATRCFYRVIELAPHYPVGHLNLARALQAQGLADEAEAALRRCIALDPTQGEAWFNLGILESKRERYTQAASCFRSTIERRPDDGNAHFGLAYALHALGQSDEACDCYKQALELVPEHVEALIGMGVLLQEKGELDRCAELYGEVLRLQPDHGLAHYNIGTVYKARHQLKEAAAHYRHAIRLQPDFADAHFSYAMVLLVTGDFASGWPEYEWRWCCKGWTERTFDRPKWDGCDPMGLTILLHSEQGFGDTIQFIRYARQLKARGARVLLLCQPELCRLLATCPDVDGVVAHRGELPPFDVHLPLLSLPAVFRTDLASIPARVPYLSPCPVGRADTRARGSQPAGNLRIGIVWSGNPTHVGDRLRSCALEDFLSLANVPGVELYSLQKGHRADDLKATSGAGAVKDLSAGLGDFLDTAHALSELDLLITVDTAVAHLAGALARPVWMLLPYVPDWRWLLDRDDSPWYPTFRLFRQSEPGDWAGVFDAVRRRLIECRASIY